MTQPRVVIVGGGFGGLFAAHALAGAPVSVTLIDKRNYHLLGPLLYQVATGLLPQTRFLTRSGPYSTAKITSTFYWAKWIPRLASVDD